jgi:hypothetical protein
MAETKKKETREQIILHTPEALWVDQRSEDEDPGYEVAG